MIRLTLLALPVAIALTPWFAARLLLPRASRLLTLGAACLLAWALNVTLPLLLHLIGLPLSPPHLALTHLALGLGLLLGMRSHHRSLIPVPDDSAKRLLPVAVLMALLVLPFTAFTGIDTYKWQDLAQNLRIEQRIPWLVHPVSWLGFTPRSYPSIYPIVSGSLQTMGHLGTDLGFYVMSLLTAFTGLVGAALLAACLTPSRPAQAIYAALYVLSPVFMRYTHWATGRGAFLALFPFAIAACLQLRRKAAWPVAVALLLAMPAAHKTGLVALLLIPIALVGAALLRPGFRRVPWVGLAIALSLSVALCPARLLPRPLGNLVGWVRLDLARFVWLSPLIIAGLAVKPAYWMSSWRHRVILLMYLGALPILHASREMYGAMLALPQATLIAMASAWQLGDGQHARQRNTVRVLLLLTFCAGLAVVVQRSLQATPRRIQRAARFLDRHDPTGPFVIEATHPPRARAAFQAYALGCPRFRVTLSPRETPLLEPPPSVRHLPPSAAARASIAWLRNLLNVDNTVTDWYGSPERRYTAIVDGHQEPPPDGRLIYDEDGVQLYEEARR